MMKILCLTALAFCTGFLSVSAQTIQVSKDNRTIAVTATDKVVFSDIRSFGLSYWYIVALCITFYSAIFPFETFAYQFFMDAHHVTREAGGDLVGPVDGPEAQGGVSGVCRRVPSGDRGGRTSPRTPALR